MQQVLTRIKEIEMVDLDSLVPHEKNMNKHPADQISRLAEIIRYQGFRNPVIVSNLSGKVVAGHGRILAAKKLGMKMVPVSRQDFADETEEYACMVSDNSIASWAELDLSQINMEVVELGPDFDLDLLGIKDFVLDPSDLQNKPLTEEQLYSMKIKSPIYEPKGERPSVNSLCDSSKTESLIGEINSSAIPDEVKRFLSMAAQRHLVFNYGKIAEYYAHAPKEVQELMEKSALIIIDFNKAIENGFVELTANLSKEYPNDGD